MRVSRSTAPFFLKSVFSPSWLDWSWGDGNFGGSGLDPLYPLVSLLLLANTVNIAADVAAMGDAMTLVAGGKAQWYAALFGVVSVLLQVFVPYSRYVKVLKWLTLALLAYVATMFVVDIPWRRVLSEGMVLPGIPWKKEYITTIVAVFGTTISPYLFFWQASQEVEDLRADDSAFPLKKAPRQARAGYVRIDRDTYIGMGFSNMVAFFIMLTTAVARKRPAQPPVI